MREGGREKEIEIKKECEGRSETNRKDGQEISEDECHQ